MIVNASIIFFISVSIYARASGSYLLDQSSCLQSSLFGDAHSSCKYNTVQTHTISIRGNFFLSSLFAYPEGGGGGGGGTEGRDPPPQNNHKNVGFLSRAGTINRNIG